MKSRNLIISLAALVLVTVFGTSALADEPTPSPTLESIAAQLKGIGKTLVVLGRILLARMQWRALGGRMSISDINELKSSLNEASSWFD